MDLDLPYPTSKNEKHKTNKSIEKLYHTKTAHKKIEKEKKKYKQKASIIITGQVNLNKKQTKEIKKGQKKGFNGN